MKPFPYILFVLSFSFVLLGTVFAKDTRRGITPVHEAALKGVVRNARVSGSPDKTRWEDGGDIMEVTLKNSKPIDGKLCANICKHILGAGLDNRGVRYFLQDGSQYELVFCGKSQADYEWCNSLTPISSQRVRR